MGSNYDIGNGIRPSSPNLLDAFTVPPNPPMSTCVFFELLFFCKNLYMEFMLNAENFENAKVYLKNA